LSYDQQTGRYLASGNVQLKQGELELRSRTLWWNQASGEVEAAGEVQLTAPQEELTGSKVLYNLQQGTGTVENGSIFLREPNLHLHGKRIERLGESTYRVTEGTFTSCDGETPSWKFGASRLDLTLGGYAKARDAVFYLKDIPVFYFPYLVYPAENERKSGLLLPEIGYSERHGFQYSGSYYQVLGPNQDATLSFDYLAKTGFGEGLEYRYVFARQNAGEARIYHLDLENDDQRYALQWRHDGQLPGGVRMVADAEYVDDLDYFEDYGEVAADYNKDKVQSVFFLSRNWGKSNLVGQLKYIKDLEVDDPTTLQQLPRVSFDLTRRRIADTPFYSALASEYTNFWRDQGLRGQRLTLRPSLSASLQLWERLAVTPEVGYRESAYWGLSDGSADQQDGVFDFSVRLNTRLRRIYASPTAAIDRLRHSLEPEILYLYTPGNEQRRLPGFDSLDRISEANRFEYALVQRLTARLNHDQGAAGYRELLYLRLSQSYDLRQAAAAHPFSAIRAELTLLPSDWASLSLDSAFDVDQGEWTKVAVEGAVHDRHANALQAAYRSDRDEELEYGSLRLDVAFLKPFYVSYQQRYDFSSSKQLEQVVGVEYRQQCWSLLLTFSENNTDRSLLLSFSMKGIGSVGGVGGGI
jgi:LPS-assembly protein